MPKGVWDRCQVTGCRKKALSCADCQAALELIDAKIDTGETPSVRVTPLSDQEKREALDLIKSNPKLGNALQLCIEAVLWEFGLHPESDKS